MSDLLKALLKLGLVLLTFLLVGILIYRAYQFAFPPAQETAKLDLPQFDLFACAQNTGTVDPADFVYAYQLQQRQEQLAKVASTDSRETTFTVGSGELPADIATKLKLQGFIQDSDLFVTLLKCRHASEKIQAGDHALRRNMTMDEIVIALEKGLERGITVTITPGLRAEQVADYLGTINLPRLDRDEFKRLVQNGSGNFSYDFLDDRPKDAPSSLEGFLFPETYNVLQGITAEQLINRFLAEYDRRITPDLRQKATARNLTLFEAMTLASIVEREAALKSEAPIIASVYYNRLKKKMLLNADPTVQYAMGYQAETKQWWPVATLQSYSRVNSPYNTYLYTGLPPAPICEPSLNSVMAVLDPATTDFLYFVAKGDGSHAFARTLEEHNANLAKYGYQLAPKP